MTAKMTVPSAAKTPMLRRQRAHCLSACACGRARQGARGRGRLFTKRLLARRDRHRLENVSFVQRVERVVVVHEVLLRRVEQCKKIIVRRGGLHGAIACSRDRGARVERRRAGHAGIARGATSGRCVGSAAAHIASALSAQMGRLIHSSESPSRGGLVSGDREGRANHRERPHAETCRGTAAHLKFLCSTCRRLMQMGAAGNEQRREIAFGFASGCSDGRRGAHGSAAPLPVRQVAVHVTHLGHWCTA